MATVDNTISGAPPGQAGSSGGPQEQLLDDIKKTKGKLEKLEEEIKELKERDVEIFVADWRFSTREKLEAALLRLEDKEKRKSAAQGFHFHKGFKKPVAGTAVNGGRMFFSNFPIEPRRFSSAERQ